MPGYNFVASPTLYTGQTVTASIEADSTNGGPVTVGLHIQTYGANDTLEATPGPEVLLALWGAP